jgi:hypothetical protein
VVGVLARQAPAATAAADVLAVQLNSNPSAVLPEPSESDSKFCTNIWRAKKQSPAAPQIPEGHARSTRVRQSLAAAMHRFTKVRTRANALICVSGAGIRSNKMFLGRAQLKLPSDSHVSPSSDSTAAWQSHVKQSGGSSSDGLKPRSHDKSQLGMSQ